MFRTIAIYFANGNLDRLTRRQTWRAFKKEVESTRTIMSYQISNGVPLEEVLDTLKQRDSAMRGSAAIYHGGQPIELDNEAIMEEDVFAGHIARKHLHGPSRRQMETTRTMAPLWEMAYNYGQSQGYTQSQVDDIISERAA